MLALTLTVATISSPLEVTEPTCPCPGCLNHSEARILALFCTSVQLYNIFQHITVLLITTATCLFSSLFSLENAVLDLDSSETNKQQSYSIDKSDLSRE
jgi:hypothetical protein